jgi:dTDP-4-amino-4,6-dideoxygalactose transaminase
MVDELRAIEASGVFSNGGPVVRRFEADAVEHLFGGRGECLAIANATLGLMMAIRHATGGAASSGRMALMPSLTFAATAHAAIWAGLTPLICDVDAEDWAASAEAEDDLLRKHGSRIAVVVPYATFGNAIDLERYRWLSQRYGVGVVVDAAASLGTIDAEGRGFGAGAPFPVVSSMHATKTFATAEGGLIYSADADLVKALRRMSNFGFDDARSAIMPGINAKLPELLGLLALAKLGEIEEVCDHRAALTEAYRAGLGDFMLQKPLGRRQAMQFMPLLLPPELASARAAILASLAAEGIGAAHYFSPHLAEQPYFRESCIVGPTPTADEIGARMLSLPITDAMSVDDVGFICDALRSACEDARSAPRRSARVGGPVMHSTVVIGGGQQAGQAGRARPRRAGDSGTRPGLGCGPARRLCDHVGQHRRDFPQRGEGQCTSRHCCPRASSERDRNRPPHRRARRAAGA